MGARFASLFECSLNFQSASYLNRQCIHSGRMSQCYTSWSLCSVTFCATLTKNVFFAEVLVEVDVVFLFVYQRGETHVIIHPSVRVLMNGYEFFPLYSQLIVQVCPG